MVATSSRLRLRQRHIRRLADARAWPIGHRHRGSDSSMAPDRAAVTARQARLREANAWSSAGRPSHRCGGGDVPVPRAIPAACLIFARRTILVQATRDAANACAGLRASLITYRWYSLLFPIEARRHGACFSVWGQRRLRPCRIIAAAGGRNRGNSTASRAQALWGDSQMTSPGPHARQASPHGQ